MPVRHASAVRTPEASRTPDAARTSHPTRTIDLVSAADTAPAQPAGTIGFVLYGAVPAGTGDLAHVLEVVEAVRSLAVEALPGTETTAAVTLAGDPSTADHVERVHQAVQQLTPPGTAEGQLSPPAVPPSRPSPHGSLSLVHVSRPAARPQASALTVDLDARKVTRDGAELALTYLEYELLVFLADHAGRVFSRTELLRYVWGYDHVVGGRTVDVHVKRLRAKLGNSPDVGIETVRGVGYRFAGKCSLRPARQVAESR